MKNKIVGRQYVSKDCFVCGTENPAGLVVKFYETENKELIGVFTAKEIHQSYPGRVHGGVISAVLDELVGRVIMIDEPETWGVTAELTVRYKKPVPVGVELTAIGRVTKNSRLIFEGEGEIILENGDIAATAHAKYMKMPLSKITEGIDKIEDFMYCEEGELPEYL